MRRQNLGKEIEDVYHGFMMFYVYVFFKVYNTI